MVLDDIKKHRSLHASVETSSHRESLLYTMKILHFINLNGKASFELKRISSSLPSLDGVVHQGDMSPWNTWVQVLLLWALLLVYEACAPTHHVSSCVWSPCLSHSLFRLWLDTTHQSSSSIFSKKNLGILPQYLMVRVNAQISLGSHTGMSILCPVFKKNINVQRQRRIKWT